MRRILSLLMLCALLGGSLPLPAAHAEAVQNNDFTYALQLDDTFMVTDYLGTSTEVAIPSEFEGKPVTAIGANAFQSDQLELTSVTIPPSITHIGDFAFARNRLTAIEIPSVTYIGRGAFQYNQLQSVELGDVIFMNAYAFADNQLERMTIPDSLTLIEVGAFQRNRLTSVSLPEGLRQIYESAFADNQLTTLQIPSTVTAIYARAFENNRLGNVALPPNIDLGSDNENSVFSNNPKVTLYDPGGASVNNHATKYSLDTMLCTYTIKYDGNGSTGGDLPASTAYRCYKQASAVPGQGSLTKDGYTFKGWNTKPDGSGTNYDGGIYPIIYGIQDRSFTLYANWELNSYQVSFDPGGGAPIADRQEILHGEHAVEPPAPSRTDYVFEGWYSETGYSRPWDFDNDTVTEDRTLYAKWKWNGPATIASVELTTDGDNVTGGDTVTITVTVRDNHDLPVANAVVNLSSNMGQWKLTNDGDMSTTTDANGEITAEWTAPWVEASEPVTITASVDGTIGMADSQTIPIVPSEKSNVRLSGLSLGYGELDSITLSPAFSDDTLHYAAADVGNAVTSIDVTATTDSQLSTLTIHYSSAASGSTFGVPAGSGSAVSVPLQTGLNLITVVVSAADGIHTQAYTILVRRDDTATSGDYAYSLKDEGSGIAIKRYNGTDSDVDIPEKLDGYVVTEIGMNAFANEELTSVTIPDTVTTISSFAFNNNLLTAVTLPKALTSIGDYAFYGNELAEITLPDGLTAVPSHAFENNQLTSISIPSSVTLVDDYAFSNNLLTEANFAEDGLQEIGFGAFSDNQLSSVILPKTTTYLDTNAFINNKLTKVIMPATLQLGDNVFGGTQNGLTLVFPAEGDRDMVNYATSNGFPFVASYVHVEYDGNGDSQTEGEAPVDYTHYDYYSSVPIQPSGSLKREGYTFQGWSTEKDGSGQFYEAGKSYAFKLIGGIVKLYAVWEPAPYSVSFETNGGTVVPATTVNGGALLAEPTPAPSKAGYRFAGWYLDPDYKTRWNFEQDTVAGDMTLYAKWESKQLAVSLVTSGNTVFGGQEISVTGTVYDEDDTPQANVSVHLSSSSGGMWSVSEASEATVTTDDRGTFEVTWEAPHVFDAATAELSASLDGSSTEPATVSIQVNPLLGPILSSDAGLAGLTLSDGDLTPELQAEVTSYTADVGYATSSVAIIPEVSDEAATVTVNGNVVESGQPVQIDLNVGSNSVTIVVTAEDGTTQTYDVTVKRASAPIVTIPVANVTVTSVQSSVYEGDRLQMIVIVSPDDAANKQVSWSVQNGTGAAAIDENGLLTAQKAGTVTVQATAQDGSGVVGSLAITIYERQQDGDPTTPTDPTPPIDNAGTQPTAKPPVLHVVPGRPPIDVNDAEAVQTMIEALTAKFNDPKNANAPVFPDAENHWAADSIRLFARLGIVQGYRDGTFKPDASVTRGEFAAIIVKLYPLAQGSAASPEFSDLGNGWVREAVLTLAGNGIISGYEDGTFRADREITRAEMVAIIARIVNLASVKQENTVNLQDIDHAWAKEQIQLAANTGIINGRSENAFAPEQSATRAEALTVLLRAILLSPEIAQLLEGMN
ncbi:leucine-rich repeat protein [Cohnella lubricantis]|uniref:leucine-rich repeat protein n=1 Tax=Cohnella lubricantis TaxID=2163172 RepID=UPI0039EF11D7